MYEVSEAVARGHPDKICDQISDAILDACLEQDPDSRVAVEALISHNLLAIGGEISTDASINIEEIARSTLLSIGYTELANTIEIITSIQQQSPDISQSVGKKGSSDLTAGDQGMVYGYASLETQAAMPLSYEIARSIIFEIQKERPSFLELDGKTQVALDTTDAHNHSLVLSWQHSDEISSQEVQNHLLQQVKKISSSFHISFSSIIINPSGRFVLGGPAADTGLTGRKQIVDSYGGSVRHGGGAFSGKDATKVDRSGAYMARWIAKHIIAAKLASKCEVQLIYSIGKKDPLSIAIDCFDTQSVPVHSIQTAIQKNFDLSVGGIISSLTLTRPIFLSTSFGGHFGRSEFSWEQTPRCDALLHDL
jgi:S-adenosylmethionine synthetase